MYVEYRIVDYCGKDFNLAIGSIRDIKIRDHFIRDILYLALYRSHKFLVAVDARVHCKMLITIIAS